MNLNKHHANRLKAALEQLAKWLKTTGTDVHVDTVYSKKHKDQVERFIFSHYVPVRETPEFEMYDLLRKTINGVQHKMGQTRKLVSKIHPIAIRPLVNKSRYEPTNSPYPQEIHEQFEITASKPSNE